MGDGKDGVEKLKNGRQDRSMPIMHFTRLRETASNTHAKIAVHPTQMRQNDTNTWGNTVSDRYAPGCARAR